MTKPVEEAMKTMAMLSAGKQAEDEIINLDDDEYAAMMVAACDTWRPLISKIHEGKIHSWKDKCSQGVKDLSCNATELVNAMSIMLLYETTLRNAGCLDSIKLCTAMAQMAAKMNEQTLSSALDTWTEDKAS